MWQDMITWDNLWLAFRKAAKGKRGGGSAANFEHQVADRLLALHAELRNKTYRPARIAISISTSRSGARSVPRRFATAWCITRCAT